MQKYRQSEPRVVAVVRGEIGGGVELAQVEFLSMAHAVMALARAHAGEHHEVDAVGLDRAVGERAHKVVAAGREGELQTHCSFHACLIPGDQLFSTLQPKGLRRAQYNSMLHNSMLRARLERRSACSCEP